MPLFMYGLSHKSAPLEVRERLAFDGQRVGPALADLRACAGVHEAALISTCNRTEVYTVLDAPSRSNVVPHWLADCRGVDPAWLSPYLYIHRDTEMVRHLLRVAPGLDSLVLGEPQICGQTKRAYTEAMNAGTLGQVLARLFQHAFAVSKQVRSETGIGANPVSVAFAAVSLARQILGDISGYTALLIGAGETMELTARHLYEQGMRRFIVANRNLQRARELASRYHGQAVDLAALPTHLEQADVVIASTGSQVPVLGKGSVEQAVRCRKRRPIFMVDIAVPRDIEPQVGELDDVYLYTVDDLQAVIQGNVRSRQDAAKHAEAIINLQVERFHQWLRSLDSVPVIRRYRERGIAHRDALLDRAKRRLRCGDDPEAVMECLAHTLTNRLMHEPTTRLREASQNGRADMLDNGRLLLGLDSRED
ncbi:glutamyl-tRNA reductase [Aquisalimonas sp.]|uniref:glutamyl-tRNA reductase n=1 Tax=Aquisalimonas sp. TaxID=1872621 RepID=UPI0025BD3B1E|nr:glutamyl-tRNA reductase [Aquisalimonas sp.]